SPRFVRAQDPLQRQGRYAPLPSDDRRFVCAAPIHRRPFRRDLLPQAPRVGRFPRRTRAGDPHARRRAPPVAPPPPRPPRRTLSRSGDEPRVRDAHARALLAGIARWPCAVILKNREAILQDLRENATVMSAEILTARFVIRRIELTESAC